MLAGIRAQFGLREAVVVGDRGMITSKHVREFQAEESGLQWISALRGKEIQHLLQTGDLQASLFEEVNLIEFISSDYPGERLVACRNPLLASERAHHRPALLEAASVKLKRIQERVNAGRLKSEHAIGLKVGAALEQHKMSKHFNLTIREGHFTFERNQLSIDREAATDGIYIIRSNTPEASKSAADLVRTYKDLRFIEQLFRTLKGLDIAARPIHHRKADRTQTHLFICMLAYYVRWHLERAWAPLTYRDHEPLNPEERDPIAPATRSAAAQTKAATHTTSDGETVHSFKTLLGNLNTIVRNTHQHPDTSVTITLDTIPTPYQQRAFELLETIRV
jgi:hypothetical protein